MEIQKLSLLIPLYYVPELMPNPFAGGDSAPLTESGEEMLYCFELDETQYLNFEPDKTLALGSFVFGGAARGDKSRTAYSFPGNAERGEAFLELPAGNYLFAQERKVLDKESVINMAVEIQLEGLWQRLKPGRRLYLRRLFEDGSQVTQLLRPFV
jgi:hypothetical protein